MSILQDLISQATGTQIDSDKSFLLPKDKDYDIGTLSSEYAKTLENSLGDGKSNKGVLYYVDGNLYNTAPGFYPEANVIVVRATPIARGMGDAATRRLGQRAYNTNQYDGDTMYFTTSGIDDGNTPITVGSQSYQNFRTYVAGNTSINSVNAEEFGLRFLGLNCPEITHYTIVPKTDNMATKTMKFSEVQNEANYVYDRTKDRNPGDEIDFVQVDDVYNSVWNEVVDDNYRDSKIEYDMEEQIKDHPEHEARIRNMVYYKIVYSDESEASKSYQAAGLKARDKVTELLEGAEDILLMIDHKTINKRSGQFPDAYNDDYWTSLWNMMLHPFDGVRRAWENIFGPTGYRYLGYNTYGQDAYKRFLGTMYVKKKIPELGGVSAWINASKYVIQSVGEEITILPEYNSDPLQIKNNSFSADAFKLWTYNTDAEKIVDALSESSVNRMAEVRKLQKDLVGIDFESARDYTVMIGDCLFMVPPTSIRSVTQTSSERVPLLRSRGSMVKSLPQSERLIEMHLYFNSEEGINGMPTTGLTKLPNGKPITYYMNGLRQMISMFKLTPFLPIDNHYINEVLNVEAVSLANMQVSTVPGYPRLLAVVLTLEEFNYHMYMPEIPVPDYASEDLNKNLFAGVFDFDVMRWHTQRPILKGESIKDLEFNSPEYIAETFGNKTALQPMRFTNSGVEFYVPNKEYLDEQLKLKIEAMNRPLKTQNTVTAEMKAWAKQVARVYDTLSALGSNENFQAAMDDLNATDGDYSISVFSEGSIASERSGFNSTYTSGSLDKTRVTKRHEARVKDKAYMFKKIDNVYQTFREHLGNVVNGLWMSEDVDYRTSSTVVTWNMDIAVDASVIQNQIYLDNFMKIMAGELQYQVSDFFVDNRIRLAISASFDPDGVSVGGFYYNTSSPGAAFLQRCSIAYGSDVTDEDIENLDDEEWAGLPSDTMQDELGDQKQTIDIETVESLTFDKYEIGDVHIKNVACVFGNTLSKMTLKAMDGKAPQYAGGQDTVIEVSIETRDENAVSLLNALPRIAAAYARDYRLVLPCWPLRMNSDLTRMLGVNEVLVESVDVNTVAGQPGLFDISIRLMSVDRTVRNKEALKKLDVVSNAGSITADATANVVVKGYFDLQNTLARAEVYPDLELPTLDELRAAGFRFLKYSNLDSPRTYPDPDFYFYYGHVLGNEIIRTAILNYSKDTGAEYEISDRYGAAVTIKSQNVTGYEVTGENATAKEMATQKRVIDQIVKEVMSRKRTDQSIANQQIVDVYSQMQMYQTWDISDNIRCMFREKKYVNVIDEKDPFAKKIEQRVDEICAAIDEVLDLPIGTMNLQPRWNDKGYIKSVSRSNAASTLYDKVDLTVRKHFVEGSPLMRAASLLEADISNTTSQSPYSINELIKKLSPMLMAAADAASGEMEYANKESRKDWQARPFLFPESVVADSIGYDPEHPNEALLTPFVLVSRNTQAEVGRMYARSLQDAMDYGTSFGPFQIRTYDAAAVSQITGIEINSTDQFFLDPWVVRKQLEGDTAAVDNYKRWISMDMEASAEAFLRNVMVWMKKLLKEGTLLSIFELVQDEAMQTIDSNQYLNANGLSGGVDDATAAALKEEAEKAAAAREAQQKYDLENKIRTQAEIDAENELVKQAEQQVEDQQAANKLLSEEIRAMLKESKVPLAMGKFFASTIMAISSGDETLHTLMKDQDYESLNQITRGAQLPNASQIPVLKKYILALAGRKQFDLEEIGKQSESLSGMMGNLINEMYAIKAAEDPDQYIQHSFYDMIVNDKRGRMARAFPTYYMIFVDEGREIGLWKLHDNFYNMSAISELQVTKSRKIAADTARIVMTNMFKTYTTDDEDSKELALDNDVLKNYQYGWRDLWNSVFSPRTYFMKEELKRIEAMPANRVKIKPGVRVHLRMGYSADASELPILFNGVVAEVGAGEVMELVAQGDGVELTNPILSTSDAEDVQHEESFVVGRIFKNWLTKGATPRTILGSLLTSKGGWLKKQIYEVTNGRYFNRNPYGIIHFGEPAFTDIFQNGEVTQNIYEGSARPGWANEKSKSMLREEYSLDDAPRISTEIFGKSYWDIMHICASAAPDYIASTVPFGFRSSIFYGAPRFYYAYEYARDNVNQPEIDRLYEEIAQLEKQVESSTGDNQTGRIYAEIEKKRAEITALGTTNRTITKERRKPFQQYHIYTSYGDIVTNKIRSNAQDVRTCAIGLYESQGVFARKNMKRVGPLWVDYDIYPEYQKTMTVDTQLLAKGTAILGDIIPFYNWVQNELADSEGMVQGGYELAWRMTATALKNSIKDMYQGELIVMGDPTVKPYDKMWIEDVIERIQGCCEVEAVVHNFDVVNGYTTSIFADCIATIDDQQEKIVQHKGNLIVAKAAGLYVGVVGTSMVFANKSRPLMRALVSYATKTGTLATKSLNNVAGLLGKEELIRSEAALNLGDDVRRTLGINTTSYKLNTYVRSAGKWQDVLGSVNTSQINTLADLAKHYDNLAKTMTTVDPKDLLDSLKAAQSSLTGTQVDEMAEAIETLTQQQSRVTDTFKNINIGNSKANLQNIINAAEATISGEPDVPVNQALRNSLNDLQAIVDGADELTDPADVKRMADAMKVISVNASEVNAMGDLAELATHSDEMLRTVKTSLSVVDDVAKVVRTDAKIIRGAKLIVTLGKGAIAGVAISMALEMAITYAITSFVYEYIERWMKNLQVLQIFPLKKDGMVMTAGLNGSKGVVVGSPTYDDSGTIKEWLGNLFADHGGAYDLVRDLFASAEMKEIAARFRSRSNIPDPDTVVGRVAISSDILKAIASDEMKLQQQGYNGMLMLGRISTMSGKDADAAEAYRNYAILDADTVAINADIRDNMIPLQYNDRLVKAMDAGYFKLLHVEGIPFSEATIDNKEVVYTNQVITFNLEGSPKAVNAIRTTLTDTAYMYDLPFLRPDAYYMVDRILQKLEEKYKVNSENVKDKDKIKEHPVVIHSALRAGENKWTSTGFVFRVQAVGEDLGAILKEISDEQEEHFALLGESGKKYFQSIKRANDMYDISVFPPNKGYNTAAFDMFGTN